MFKDKYIPDVVSKAAEQIVLDFLGVSRGGREPDRSSSLADSDCLEE